MILPISDLLSIWGMDSMQTSYLHVILAEPILVIDNQNNF